MTEQALKDFFENKIGASTLAADVIGSRTRTGMHSTQITIVPLLVESQFRVSAYDLVRLCEAVLEGHLQLLDLNTIGFAMMSSDNFDRDQESVSGRIVSEAIFAWDNPEIDYDLTTENVGKWKHYLTTGESLFDPQELKRKK